MLTSTSPLAPEIAHATSTSFGVAGLFGAGQRESLAAVHLDGLLSFLSPRALISDFFSALASWVISGTADFLSQLGGTITRTTQPDFGSAFQQSFAEVVKIAAALSLPFLVLALIQAIARQDLSLLLRAALVRLPVAFLLTGAATALVSLALGVTDQCSNALLSHGGTSVRQLVSNLVSLLGGPGPLHQIMSGFSGVVIAGFAIVVALVLWVELAFRSAAVMVATLFLPIALAGLIWSATAHWARRLGETLAALILAKLVVVGVLVLAAGMATPTSGVGGLAEGLGLLLVAVVSPFSLLRLVPIVEAGAIGHLEGMGRRGVRAGMQLASAGGQLMSRAWGGADGAGSSDGGSFAAYEALPTADTIPGIVKISRDDPRLQSAIDELKAEAAAFQAGKAATGSGGDGL